MLTEVLPMLTEVLPMLTEVLPMLIEVLLCVVCFLAQGNLKNSLEGRQLLLELFMEIQI